MPELIAYILIVALLLLVLVSLNGTYSTLKRIEKRLAEAGKQSATDESAPSSAESSAGGAFEAFLDENPDLRLKSKAEQFAAYRQWRHDNGLNWRNS
ncbi:MAG: hypothetical protein H8M99_10575 [Gloeobacteraceae cyanobacterium ES-bin-144]|nr:hypothetical protein [Verrucomicrobiales bacterium]